MLNRAGTTFKKLPDADKEGLTEKKALALMLAQPSMIKRPVLELGGKLVVGFKPEIYAKEVARQEGLGEANPIDDIVGCTSAWRRSARDVAVDYRVDDADRHALRTAAPIRLSP